MKIGNNLFFVVLFLHFSNGYAQLPKKTWDELNKAFADRNGAIAVILSSSSDFKDVPDQLKNNIKGSMDTITHELAIHNNPSKSTIKRIEKSNNYLTKQIQDLLTILESSEGKSNYGNAVRLTSIYKNAEEIFRASVKEYNQKVRTLKRKDLILTLL
jgi:hypothetical protein